MPHDMYGVNTNLIRARMYWFFRSRVTRHVLLWLALVFVLTFTSLSRHGFWLALTYEIVNVFFYTLIVYFNIYYLIPNYLAKKRFFTYALLLILASIVITPLQVFADYLLFTNRPLIQQDLLENQNYFFLLTFLIAGTSTVFKIISDWVRHLRETQALETQAMQTELKFLKSQINPHFLFNTLNNLYALTLKKSDQAPEIVLRLSEMMRYMLYECNERRVLLSKEVNYIENYLELERLRQGKYVRIDFEVRGRLHEQKIAPLMFIPFLENSFKHGLSNHLSPSYVEIKMHVEENQARFFIENSKPESLPRQEHRRSGGIGLVNVNRRLNLLYPNRYELKINDTPSTYSVDLKIELD
jgi:two-component system LytT family sensor kinase